MIMTAVLVIAAAIAGLLIYAASKPDTFRVVRAAVINAPPEKIFSLINDFRQWPLWSPWENKDPGMKRVYGTITAGKGATYSWEGNKAVGKGGMEITDAVPPKTLNLRLDFIAPFEAHNTVSFTLTPMDSSTQVTWAMEGPANFMTKLMQVFMDMDRMVGTDFEAGLAAMKSTAEK